MWVFPLSDPPPADDALCGDPLMDSLSSRRLGSEIGRGILDLLERLVRLDSVEVALLPSDPGVEGPPVQEEEEEPFLVHAQLAQCSLFL